MSAPGSSGEIAPPSKGDLSALRHIAAENVTWRTDARGRTSYRLWSTETHYRTCTPAVKRVIERGWAKQVHGFLHGRGGVDLTDLGRAVLAAHFASPQDARCPHGFPSGGWDCCRHDPSLDDHMEDT